MTIPRLIYSAGIALLLGTCAAFQGCQQRAELPMAPVDSLVGAYIGDTAPSFTLNDPSGNIVTIEQFRGKVVMIDFWASWCGPCVAALPELKALWEKYRGQDFVILGISADYDPSTWKQFIKENKMDWVHVYDRTDQYSAGYKYGVEYIPETFVLDRNGLIASRGARGSELDTVIARTLRR